MKYNSGEGGRWAGRPAARSSQVGAVEEAAAAVRVLDFQGSPPWLASLEREGLGGGLKGSERDGSGGAEWAVGDNRMGTRCQWRGQGVTDELSDWD
jgi:hypothetical protein